MGKVFVTVSIVLIVSMALAGSYYITIYKPQKELEERIRPLVQAGLTRENALYIVQNYPQLLATPNVLTGDYDSDNVCNQEELFGSNSDILNPVVPNHLTVYALNKGLPKYVVKQLKILGEELDNDKRVFIDYLTRLDNITQRDFCSFIVQDRVFSQEEKNQVAFLYSLDNQTNGNFVRRRLIYNFDVDGDNFSNWFEKNMAKTDYLSPNNRYAILLSKERRVPSEITGVEYILKNPNYGLVNDIPENHIIPLESENATFEKLSQAIDRISSLADNDDLVFILLDGDGGRYSFYAYNDERIDYEDLKQQINKLNSYIILFNDSCYSGSSLPYLSGDKRVIISVAKENEMALGPNYIIFFDGLYNKSAATPLPLGTDFDNNGYVSVAEAFFYLQKYIEESSRPFRHHPQISNLSLAERMYLFERPVK